ncbi:hypothetical protein RJZ57_006990, partial [Blastomyces gilchristii]
MLKYHTGAKVLKCSEGLHNKAFILTMDNGVELLAKLPNPNAGPAHYTTASEVATCHFLREIFNIPVPRILAWSSDASNPVGAEYIIEEKASGVRLGSLWNHWSRGPKLKIITQIAQIEDVLTSISFPKHGCIYFKEDLLALTGVAPDLEGSPSVLWHPDLHLNNVFVDPESHEITYIVDWQSAAVVPLFFQWWCTDNVPSFQAGHTPFLRKPVWLVTGVWENRDLFFLRQSLLSLMAHWEEFRNGVPCPLSFSEEGLKLHAKEEENMDGIGQLLKISQDQGVLPVDDGMVEHEDYETAKENRIVGNSR